MLVYTYNYSFQVKDKRPKKPKRRRQLEPETPEWIDVSLKPVKQVDKDVEEPKTETVELKQLSGTEDSAPEDQTAEKPKRPETVEKAPKDTAQTDQEKPKKKPKKKTKKRDTPDELPKAEEAELSSPEEQVCYYPSANILLLSLFGYTIVIIVWIPLNPSSDPPLSSGQPIPSPVTPPLAGPSGRRPPGMWRSLSRPPAVVVDLA